MDAIDRNIINTLQGGFPIIEQPFAVVADRLGLPEIELIGRLRQLCDEGWLSRFGPMFDADRLGGATLLAALCVPADEFERVAALVNAHPEVAHNYARDHALNMWFVVAVESGRSIGAVIAAIEAETGLEVYPMAKEHEFFVQARFEA